MLVAQTTKKYGCWVMPLSVLQHLDEAPEHVAILSQLEELMAGKLVPSSAYSFFISQASARPRL